LGDDFSHYNGPSESYGAAMDKPRHPIVVRPWKTQQTQSTKWNLPMVKTEKERRRPDSKVLTAKKTRKG